MFESTDGGADWRPLNRGVRADFLPDPDPEYGHDPHCVRLHPLQARPALSAEPLRHLPPRSARRALDRHRRGDAQDRRLDRLSDGRCIRAIRTRCGCSRWTARSVWPRVSPGGKPAVYRSRNGGKTWQRQAIGLPKSQAWWTVKRQAMTADPRRRRRLLRHDDRRGVGQPRRRADVEMPRRAPAAHLRGRGGVSSGRPSSDASRAATTMRVLDPGAAALVHATTRRRSPSHGAHARRRCVAATSNGAIPAFASASSTSKGASARTSSSSSTASRRATCRARSLRDAEVMIVGALSGG